jgi:hypothetical protein
VETQIGKQLVELIGPLPRSESQFKSRMRFHQAWWRVAVLLMDSGLYPGKPDERIGSMLPYTDDLSQNFLSESAFAAYLATKSERAEYAAGMFNEQRLLNNLLSSQPLCFNFFGPLKLDKQFASAVLRAWIPEIAEVTDVWFEHAPKENYTRDNSAFDVAFRYSTMDGKKALFGIECKYTDSFSAKEYDTDTYQALFNERRTSFIKDYPEYTRSRYNQLFRNQLIAEALLSKGQYDVVTTGLFCHPDDKAATTIGTEFQGMLEEGATRFRIVTYLDFIGSLQKLELDAVQRAWTMKLWARYCGMELSEAAYHEHCAPPGE